MGSDAVQLAAHIERAVVSRSYQQSTSELDELTNALSSLAVELREETSRIALETTSIHQQLVDLLRKEEVVETHRDQVLEQVGRVAANLGADNETNLDHLLEAGYPPAVVACLADSRRPRNSTAVRALVASLLNAVASAHEPSIDVLSHSDTLGSILALSRRYSAPSADADGVEDAAKAEIALWLWRVVAEVGEHNLMACLDAEGMDNLLYPLRHFMLHEGGLSSTGLQEQRLSILEHVCNSIASMSDDAQDGPPPNIASTSNHPFVDNLSATSSLLDFLESAQLPSHWAFEEAAATESHEDDEEDTLTRDICEKRLGKAKASVIRMMIHISWDIPYDASSTFWTRMLDWTAKGPERDDLVSCGYLSLGNGAKNGEIAEILLRGPTSILPSVVRTLDSSTPVTTQHAAISLLRNIAIPAPNKAILGEAGVIGLLTAMGVFDDTRDMVETVQGGAAVVLKLLCQSNAVNAVRFVSHAQAVTEVLAVIKRVDTPSVSFEASRILANCIKSLTSDRAKHLESVARLSQADVIEVYVDLLRRTTKYPLLTNDAIISLTLVTTFGPEGSALRVLEELERVKPTKEEELASGKAVLAKITSTGPESFSKEIRANTATLLSQLKERTDSRGVDDLAAISINHR